MSKILNELKNNDRVQNQIALCFLFEYGRISLQSDSIVETIKSKNMNNPLITDEYMNSSIETARKMTELSLNDLKKFIYDDVKFEKRQERGR